MKKIFIWGTGKIASKVLAGFDVFGRYNVLGFIDNNIVEERRLFAGKQVFSPEILKYITPDIIVILNDYYDEIYTQIKKEYSDVKCRVENKNFFFKEAVCCRYKGCMDDEMLNVLKDIGENGLEVFNYDFARQYRNDDIQAYFDEVHGLWYVMHAGKRMYMAARFDNEEKAKRYYKGLLVEQNQESPHKYTSETFNVKEGDTIVDAGVAEGMFTLEHIDAIKKAYLIEADTEWVRALKLTFADYADKVVIIEKYLSSEDNGKYASLDNLIDESVDFLKMDIEGCEWDALQGAKSLIEGSEHLKCAVCVYHRDFDNDLMQHEFAKYGMKYENTRGYMWFPYGLRIGQNMISTRLCRGVLRAWK